MMSVLHPGNKQVRNVMYVLNKVIIIRQCGLLVGETVSFSTSCFMFAFSFFRFFVFRTCNTFCRFCLPCCLVIS
jgi:hypothetical protein